MDPTKTITYKDRVDIALQIVSLSAGIKGIKDKNNEFLKLGTCMTTCAAAFLNPFHMEELTQIILEFNNRKKNELLAQQN